MYEERENLEPAPLEYMNDRLLEQFHKFRLSRVDSTASHVLMDGNEFNKIVAKAKADTYQRYKKLVTSSPVVKSSM